MRHAFKKRWMNYLYFFGGDQPLVAWRERLTLSFSVFVGLMFVLVTSKALGKISNTDEWLIASLGASAFLVFLLPANPMSKAWAVVAGNTLSAVVGGSSY